MEAAEVERERVWSLDSDAGRFGEGELLGEVGEGDGGVAQAVKEEKHVDGALTWWRWDDRCVPWSREIGGYGLARCHGCKDLSLLRSRDWIDWFMRMSNIVLSHEETSPQIRPKSPRKCLFVSNLTEFRSIEEDECDPSSDRSFARL